jgi:hypothetical protein
MSVGKKFDLSASSARRGCGERAPVERSENFRRVYRYLPWVLQTLNGEAKKENVMQTPKIGTDEFMSLSPDRRLAEYYKEIAPISEGIARLAVDMQNLSPNEREEVRLYLRRRSSNESAKQSGKITTVSELLSRLVQP